MIFNFSTNCFDSVSSIKSSSLLNKIKVSSSDSEPNEICKKCMNSFIPFLAAPSEILAGTEIAALRIWEIIPNFSSEGNRLVTK